MIKMYSELSNVVGLRSYMIPSALSFITLYNGPVVNFC